MPRANPEREVYKCPVHNRWMVPTVQVWAHWACPVRGCVRKRAAKLRTVTERAIFVRVYAEA